MFTVRTRWKFLNSNSIDRNEVLFPAAYVIFGSDAKNTNGNGTQIEFYHADHSEAWAPVHFGDVFVMNEYGKTVAAYSLPHERLEPSEPAAVSEQRPAA